MTSSDLLVPGETGGRGARTRDRLLDIAEARVMEKGFGATSIEEVIFEAGLTKSGFFYHFRDKNDLARALLERFVERDIEILGGLFDRADELSEDPLHGFLIGLKMFAELAEDLPSGHPGCLMATMIMSERQYDEAVRRITQETALMWRRRFLGRLERIAALYPPKTEINLSDLADAVSVVVDGGILLSKNLKSGAPLAAQIMVFRAMVRRVFVD